MTTQPIGPRVGPAPRHWHSGSSTWSHAYLLAAVRGGLIALVLLAMLAVVVLF